MCPPTGCDKLPYDYSSSKVHWCRWNHSKTACLVFAWGLSFQIRCIAVCPSLPGLHGWREFEQCVLRSTHCDLMTFSNSRLCTIWTRPRYSSSHPICPHRFRWRTSSLGGCDKELRCLLTSTAVLSFVVTSFSDGSKKLSKSGIQVRRDTIIIPRVVQRLSSSCLWELLHWLDRIESCVQFYEVDIWKPQLLRSKHCL